MTYLQYFAILHTNASQAAISVSSHNHCSILTGAFIKHSIIIICAQSKSTDVRTCNALISIWVRDHKVTIKSKHNNAFPTNTCEGAIRAYSSGRCSIFTGTLIKCSIVIITAGSKSTNVSVLCALINIWFIMRKGTP